MTHKVAKAKQTITIFCMCMLTACSIHNTQTDTQKSMVLFTKAKQAYQLGLLEEAEADFIKITKLNPEFHEAWFRLGNIYVRTGQLKAAERMFEKSVRINPKEYKAWNNLAVTYIKQAIAILEEAKEHTNSRSEEGVHADEMATRLINAIAQH